MPEKGTFEALGQHAGNELAKIVQAEQGGIATVSMKNLVWFSTLARPTISSSEPCAATIKKIQLFFSHHMCSGCLYVVGCFRVTCVEDCEDLERMTVI